MSGRDDESGRPSDGVVRRTRRWRGIVAVALGALAVGVLAKRPELLVLSAVGVAFAAYPRVVGPPDPDLAIERELDPASPERGEVVAVTTTVRNEGRWPLVDLRIVDGVPPTLSVAEGSPRRATALLPGRETTVTYAVRVDGGVHHFSPATAVARDPSGAFEAETTVADPTTIDATAEPPEVPLRTHSRHRTGRLATDEGGSGVELYGVREYERGDPLGRIDWRRFARTGELASVEFREERLADVVCCVDARPAAALSPDEGDPNAVARAAGAARRLADALLDADHQVGLAAIGADVWVPPDSGRTHADRLRRRLSVAVDVDPPADGDVPLDGRSGAGSDGRDPGADGPADAVDRRVARIRERLDGRAQVVLCTPLCDDGAERVARSFEAAGVPVLVVSPDPTTGETVGGRLARVERENRIHALRGAGVPVVDWAPEDRLEAVLATAEVTAQ